VEFETLEEVLGEVDEGLDQVPSSSEGFRELLDEEVARALDELPLEYRTPLLLSAVEDLSYKEIADVMDCPVGTVMSRLYRGRKMLETSLKQYAQSIGFLKGKSLK
jgi:RNA polymerase sigma-70 factor (ECF subfamily)